MLRPMHGMQWQKKKKKKKKKKSGGDYYSHAKIKRGG